MRSRVLKFWALVLLVLAVSPVTAPFSPCDLATPLTGDSAAGTPASKADHAATVDAAACGTPLGPPLLPASLVHCDRPDPAPCAIRRIPLRI